MRKPLGRIAGGASIARLARAAPFVAAVGDESTLTLLALGITPDLAVVDHFIMRKPIPGARLSALKLFSWKVLRCPNPAGMITAKAAAAILAGIEKTTKEKLPVLVKVSGEEDLLLLPALLYLPTGSLAIYGQPKQGAVAVRITPGLKKKITALISKAFLPA